MGEAPPYVEGASERTPDNYPEQGSLFEDTKAVATYPAMIEKIHAILGESDGQTALNRIREVLYGRPR